MMSERRVAHASSTVRPVAERPQVAVEHADPAALALEHLAHPLVQPCSPTAAPGPFGLRRVAAQQLPRRLGKEGVLGFHVPAPGVAQADHQQAEAHQQNGQLPEQ
jgi:hypothetical protein